jgi:hypothetical protein
LASEKSGAYGRRSLGTAIPTVRRAASEWPVLKMLVPSPRRAQGVNVQVRRERDDRYSRDRRWRYASETTVGVSPGGVTVGPRQRCRMVSTTVEGDDGRRIMRQERRCDD